jgi:hypothetical protein
MNYPGCKATITVYVDSQNADWMQEKCHELRTNRSRFFNTLLTVLREGQSPAPAPSVVINGGNHGTVTVHPPSKTKTKAKAKRKAVAK